MMLRDKGNKNERGATYTDTEQLLFVMYKCAQNCAQWRTKISTYVRFRGKEKGERSSPYTFITIPLPQSENAV